MEKPETRRILAKACSYAFIQARIVSTGSLAAGMVRSTSSRAAVVFAHVSGTVYWGTSTPTVTGVVDRDIALGKTEGEETIVGKI
jgi:hypothetical protein